MNEYNSVKNLILHEMTQTLDTVHPEEVQLLVDAIMESRRVFVTGVGRVLLVMQAWAKRLNHLGISTFFVGEINEPAISDKDLLISASGSGESAVPRAITSVALKYQPKICYIGSNNVSTIAQMADIHVSFRCSTKLKKTDEVASVQPMSSLFEQSLFILGDVIALMIIKRKNIELGKLWDTHANLE